jgi:hypothetical protein
MKLIGATSAPNSSVAADSGSSRMGKLTTWPRLTPVGFFGVALNSELPPRSTLPPPANGSRGVVIFGGVNDPPPAICDRRLTSVSTSSISGTWSFRPQIPSSLNGPKNPAFASRGSSW